MTRVVVTGAAGFIGANIVKGLNARGITNVIAVDDLTQGDKFRNLADLQIEDYLDADDFYGAFADGAFGKVEAVFHEGACSDTMEQDGKYMMDNNYGVSCSLFESCQQRGSRLLYASSAAVYGGSASFRETPEFERPLNVYGYSKLLFDQRMRRTLGKDFLRGASGKARQVVGFRYFNVYGPREQHKGRMASVAFHQYHQYRESGKVKLFGPYGGYGPGQQERDFVFVDDVVAVNLWFFDRPEKSGIYNLGTGRAQPFNDVAAAVVSSLSGQPHTAVSAAAAGLLEYIPFPDALVGKYQTHTQADLSALRAAGCDHAFADVQAGVSRYMAALAASQG